MHVTTKNLYAAPSTAVELCKGITLITGKNYQGKSSLLRYIAAALTGKTPISDLKKKDSASYLAPGATEGEITIHDAHGSVSLAFPDLTRSCEGASLDITEYAAGTASLLTDPSDKKNLTLQQLLQTAPSEQDLRAALPGVPETTVARLWQTIQAQGWDSAHCGAKEKGTKLKGQWEGETGEDFGIKKIESWLPLAWTPDLATATAEQLQGELTHEQGWLETAISSSAVDAQETARLQAAAAPAEQLEKDIASNREIVATLAKNVADIRAGLQRLPQATMPAHYLCPCCSTPLVIEGGKLVKPPILTPEDLIERQRVIDDVTASLRLTEGERAKQAEYGVELQAQLKAAQEAKKKLAELQKKPAGSVPAAKIEECRARVRRAQERLTAFTKKQNAAKIAEQIIQNKKIVDVLAPDGLRQDKLTGALTKINQILAELCTAAWWYNVKILSDLTISYDNRPLVVISKSEKYRVTVTLQVAMAILDHSGLVIIDEADVLDAPGRNGLLSMLLVSKKPAIVAMTINKKEIVPPVGKIGGIAYWIENGIAERL